MIYILGILFIIVVGLSPAIVLEISKRFIRRSNEKDRGYN